MANKLLLRSENVFAPTPSASASMTSLFHRGTAGSNAGPANGPASFAAATVPVHKAAGRSTIGFGQLQKEHVGSYKALANAVLKRRLARLFVLSAVGAFGLLFVATADAPSVLFLGLFSIGRIVTLALAAGITWVGAVLPIAVLKRLENSLRPDCSPDQYNHYASLLFSAHAVQSVIVATLSSTAVWASYCLASMRLQDDPSLGPFVRVPERSTLQYNERPFYLLFVQLILALTTTYVYLVEERGVLPLLATSNCASIPSRLRRRLSVAIPPSLHRLLACEVAAAVVYAMLREGTLWWLYSSPRAWRLLHTRFHAVRANYPYLSPGLHWRALMQGMVWLLVWEATSALWAVYVTQPWSVVRFAKDPNRSLVDGLMNEKTRHMALIELSEIATFDAQARQTLYKDVRGSPRPFNLLVNECLKVMEETLRLAQGKGTTPEPPAPSTSSAPAPTRTSKKPASPRAAPLRKDLNVFQPPAKKSFLASLLLPRDPPGSASLAAAAPAAAGAAAKIASKVPEIFQSPVAPTQPPAGAAPAPGPAPPPPAASSTSVLGRLAVKVAPGWATAPRWKAKVDKRVPDWPSCALAIDSLSRLMAASLKEDPYGVAQGDLPKVFESFVACLEGLEAVERELLEGAGTEPEREAIGDGIWESIGPLQAALEAGLALLAGTFEPYLRELRLPPHVARRLRAITGQ